MGHTLLAQTATWEEIRQVCDDIALFSAHVGPGVRMKAAGV